MFQVLLLIAAFQALFFSTLLITKRNRNLADKYLFTWLMTLIAQIIFIYRSMSLPAETGLCWGYLGFCFSILHGVFLFSYTKSVTNSYTKFQPKQLLHFLLCASFILVGIIFPKHIPTFIPIVRSVSLVSTVVYIVLSLHTIRTYQSFLSEHFSSTDKLNLDWLKFLIYGLLFFCFGALVFRIMPPLFNINIPLNEIFAVLILSFISIIGFKGLKQSTIFNEKIIPIAIEEPIEEHAQIIKTENTERNSTYANYGLKDEEAIKLSERLKEYMEKDKPFTNPELNLKDLATALDVYPHYISQVLNAVFHQNFYDFVNTYRIEEAKKQLLDGRNQHLTILAIAYDCGFNSKSSFNRVFKQKTGATPSEFAKTTQ